MGRLTEVLIEDTTTLLEELFDNFRRLEGQRDEILENLGFNLAHKEIGRLGFYDTKEQVRYAIRFNEILMRRKDFLPHEIRDSIYVPLENKEVSFKILTGLMSEAILEVEDNPKSFAKKEVYLYLLQKLSPLNLPVSQGYADLFNQHQKNGAKKKGSKFYQILDTSGKGRYALSYEK